MSKLFAGGYHSVLRQVNNSAVVTLVFIGESNRLQVHSSTMGTILSAYGVYTVCRSVPSGVGGGCTQFAGGYEVMSVYRKSPGQCATCFHLVQFGKTDGII